ncbi:DUF7282 domain-containing protein [Halorientalis salina]|uniref:DUF7282 domain-containing protein n=1 Tax=Halorientalis salina TaxID=2932266 RepID=UPI0010AD5569|nr:BGTF surface domain-containing protein [Halorientalis salina]
MQRVRTMAVAVALVAIALSLGVGVAAGSPTAEGGTEQAADEEANLTVFVAPGSDLASMQGAETTDEYGDVNLTARSHTTLSDTLVVEVSAPGLETAVESQPGNGTTAKFHSLLESDRASLTAVEGYTADNDTRKVFSLNDPEAVSVARAGDGAYHLVVDLSAVETTLDANGNERPDDEETRPVESGDGYQLEFDFDDHAANGSLLVFPVAVEFDVGERGNSPVLYPMPDQRVRAQTTLAPGTELRVELTGTGPEPFQRSRTVRVTGRSQPEFTASFDLVDVSGGVPLIVVVRNGDRNVGKAEGRIPNLTAELTVPARIETKDRIRVDRTNLSQNGFLIVRAGGPDGPIVGNRYLERGTYTDLTVQFTQPVKADTLHVSAYVDIDGDQVFDRNGLDRPYRADGEPVSAVVDVTGTTGTPAVTTRPPSTSTTEPTDDTTTTVETTRTGSETDGRSTAPTTADATGTGSFTPYTITAANGPGFTAGVAVAAILSLFGLLARRR